MSWPILDAVLAVLAVLVLGVVLFVLYRAVKALLALAGRLSAVVAEASQGLAVTPPAATTGAPVLASGKRPVNPRRRTGSGRVR